MRILVDRFIYQGLRDVPSPRRAVMAVTPWTWTVLGGRAGRLAALRSLAPGIDVTRATDLLWTLNHPDTWYLLVRQCGWTTDAYEQWVGDTLSAQLLGPAGPGQAA